jgi:hypothetical protein
VAQLLLKSLPLLHLQKSLPLLQKNPPLLLKNLLEK